MSSLITSQFSGVPIKGIAFTSVSLDTPILKYQPLNNSSSSNSITPFPLDVNSKPNNITWINDSYFIVLYENKSYFELFEINNLSKVNQRIDLILSSSPASCSCASFNNKFNTLYVVDTTNRLYSYIFDQFSENKIQAIDNYVITEVNESISKISITCKSNTLLLMSNSLYEFNLESQQITNSINLFIENTNCYQLFDDQYLLISSNNDRFINLINLNSFRVSSIFVMNSPIIKFNLIRYKKKSILASIDEDGFIEIFKDPLSNISVSSTPSSKRRRKGQMNTVNTVQYNTILKLYSDENLTNLSKFDNIIFTNDQLTFAYLQNENYFIVDQFNWFNNLFDIEEIKLSKKKSSIDHLKLSSNDKASLNNYGEDPSSVTIRTGDNFIDLDSVEKEQEDGDDEDDDDIGDDFSTLVSRLDKSTTTKQSSKSNKFKFQIGTLTTNLSQALRNNDNSLFDSIINTTTDEIVVKTTISQLEQHSILKMLDKLSELVFKNKFKHTNESASLGFGNSSISLTTWIRYVLIYHGTYLLGAAGGNGDLRRRLGLLAMSMNKRADNMNRLLELKGNLSMVSIKAEVTRELENLESVGGDEMDEDDVEYVESEEDLSDEEDL